MCEWGRCTPRPGRRFIPLPAPPLTIASPPRWGMLGGSASGIRAVMPSWGDWCVVFGGPLSGAAVREGIASPPVGAGRASGPTGTGEASRRRIPPARASAAGPRDRYRVRAWGWRVCAAAGEAAPSAGFLSFLRPRRESALNQPLFPSSAQDALIQDTRSTRVGPSATPQLSTGALQFFPPTVSETSPRPGHSFHQNDVLSSYTTHGESGLN